MTAMRAHDPRFMEEVAPIRPPLITVHAGDSILVRVGAVDRQSGVGEIITHCRSCENHELTITGRWTPGDAVERRTGNYYPVRVTLPDSSPSVIWELYRIVLCDCEGNRRSYEAGRDFEGVLIQVKEKPGKDSTPPRLLGVQVSQA